MTDMPTQLATPHRPGRNRPVGKISSSSADRGGQQRGEPVEEPHRERHPGQGVLGGQPGADVGLRQPVEPQNSPKPGERPADQRWPGVRRSSEAQHGERDPDEREAEPRPVPMPSPGPAEGASRSSQTCREDHQASSGMASTPSARRAAGGSDRPGKATGRASVPTGVACGPHIRPVGAVTDAEPERGHQQPAAGRSRRPCTAAARCRAAG